MDRTAVITGVGVLSALGDSPAQLHRNLCDSRQGLTKLGLEYGSHWGSVLAGCEEHRYLGDRNARSLNRVSRLAASAAELALRDSGWTPGMLGRAEVSLVIGTMFCGVHTIGEFDRRALMEGPGHASPMDFANTVINSAAGQTAIWHGLRGINSTIAAGIGSGLHAMAYATGLVCTGQTNAVLVGGVDELCLESYWGFERSGFLCPADGYAPAFPIPFDSRRNGFAPAEAAGFVMLEESETAKRRGARILARIGGHGSSFDSSLGTSERDSIQSISRAVTNALDDAGRKAGAIECISASANGSAGADRNEAFGIADALNGYAGNRPVTAVKASLGEAMGASGPIQVISLIEARRTGLLPGIAGFRETDRDLPLKEITSENRSITFGTALVNSVSLDGNCCSLVVDFTEAA
jgi:3-oxoacyl-(acyl-carrier-protein) synthase